jgi:hypothetical protein
MMEQNAKPQRLCGEIQLFDICDLDVCSHRVGRYCTKADILARFEAINDRPAEQFFAEELDEVEGAGDMGYDEAYGVDEFEDEEKDD